MKKIVTVVLAIFLNLGCVVAQSDTQFPTDTMYNDAIDRNSEDFVSVSLLVSEPLKGILSPYGHSALRLQCPYYGLDYVFHYAMFHYIDASDQTSTYLSNQFQIILVSEEFEIYLQDGIIGKRGLKEYPLNLSPKQEQELWRILDEEKQNPRVLKRDFFIDNYVIKGCAILMADMVERVVGYRTLDYSNANPFYNRPHYEIVSRQLRYVPWAHFAMLSSMYGRTNIEYQDKLIVPANLAEVWQATLIEGKRLAGDENILTKHWYYTDNSYITPLRVAILFLVLSMVSFFIKKEYLTYVIVTMQVLMSLFVLSMDVFHLSTVRFSWLYIPFNLLPIILWRWRIYWALPYIGLLVLWCLTMFFVPHMFVDSTHIILTMAWMIVLFKQSNILKISIQKSFVQDIISRKK